MSAVGVALNRQAAVFPNGPALVQPVRTGWVASRGRDTITAPDYAGWRNYGEAFASLAAYQRSEVSFSTGARGTARGVAARVSGNFFSTLGVTPIAGRVMRLQDENVTPCAAVLTQRFALRIFGGDAAAVNQDLAVEGQNCRVVGVVRDRHAFPSTDVDLFMPLTTGPVFAKDARGRTVVSILQVQVLGQPQNKYASLAKQRFGATDAAIGKSVRVPSLESSATIIGIARDVRRSIWDAEELPVVYVHFARVADRPGTPSSTHDLVLLMKATNRTGGGAIRAQPLQEFVERSVPGLSVGTPRTIGSARFQEVEQIAAYAAVGAVFAGVTILLVALGAFAATSHLVACRSREIAIRQAIGATPAQARRAVTTSVLRWWMAATAVGMTLSVSATRLAAAAQAGLVPASTTNVALSVGVISLALILAAAVPLRRALRIEPARLMRGE